MLILSAVTLRKIKNFQKSTGFLVPKVSIQRLVREVLHDQCGTVDRMLQPKPSQQQ